MVFVGASCHIWLNGLYLRAFMENMGANHMQTIFLHSLKATIWLDENMQLGPESSSQI